EDRVPQPGLAELIQGVRLVLAGVGAPVQRPGVGAAADPGVVAGGEVAGAEREGAVEENAELDPVVAADAGVRSAPGRVLRLEVGDHRVLELLLEVPDVVGDSEPRGGAAGVGHGIDPAGAASPG